MKNINPKILEFHIKIEKVAQDLSYGAASFTLEVDSQGNPLMNSLKITKTKRFKKPNN